MLIYHYGVSLSKQHTADLLFSWHTARFVTVCNKQKSSPDIAHNVMPIISPAKEATVATHAWTKLHTQIMNWVSSIYAWLLFMQALTWSASTTVYDWFALLWAACCWRSIQTTNKMACVLVVFASGRWCYSLTVAFTYWVHKDHQIFVFKKCSF